jgi:hypothetical protein
MSGYICENWNCSTVFENTDEWEKINKKRSEIEKNLINKDEFVCIYCKKCVVDNTDEVVYEDDTYRIAIVH